MNIRIGGLMEMYRNEPVDVPVDVKCYLCNSLIEGYVEASTKVFICPECGKLVRMSLCINPNEQENGNDEQ